MLKKEGAVMITVDNIIKSIPEWKRKSVSYEIIPGGLTNKNYKVTVNGRMYVIRIPGQGTEIFINREVELHNTISASDIGIGAQLYNFFKPDYVIVVEFIKGRLMSSEILRTDNECLIKAVKAIREVHNRGKFISYFIMFDKFKDYYRIVKENRMELPEKFDDAKRMVEYVEGLFKKKNPPLVSCHNDLLAENFIEQKDKMRIIDWELSGLNDPCFDLGDFSVEQGLNDVQDETVIKTYYGSFKEDKYCWLKIYKYMADILWTLWAVIQNNTSDIKFDYWRYGLKRFERAMNAINSDNFKYWLNNI